MPDTTQPNELIKLVMQKTGLPETQARAAVDTVLGYLKEHLPAPLAGQLDALLANPGALDQVDDVVKGLGGLLGGLSKDK